MPLDAGLAVTLSGDLASNYFRSYLNELEKWTPILGDGSPEGVVEAPLYSLYVDRTATVAPIQYRKMLASISDDRRQGWVAV